MFRDWNVDKGREELKARRSKNDRLGGQSFTILKGGGKEG